MSKFPQSSDAVSDLKRKCWEKFALLGLASLGIAVAMTVLLGSHNNRFLVFGLWLLFPLSMSAWNAIDTYYRGRKKLLESDGLT